MKREFFGRPAAALVIVREGDKVLMVKRRGPWRAGQFTFPSGHVEEAEPIKVAAQRELKEEVGLDVQLGDLRFAHVCNRASEPDIDQDPEYLDFFFEATNYTGTPQNMEPEVHSEIAWIDINELDNYPVIDYAQNALKNIKNGNVYSEFGWE